MTQLNKRLELETSETVFECGQHRTVIIIIEPPCRVVSARLKGLPGTYNLTPGAIYHAAVKASMNNGRSQKKGTRS